MTLRPIGIGLLGAVFAFAHAPALQITSPTAATPLIIGAFPYSSSISFTVTHDEIASVNVLDVRVNGTSILAGGNPIGNPFDAIVDATPGCTNNITNNSAVTQCSNISSVSRGVTVAWSIPAAGSYVIEIVARHQGAEGSDEETVLVGVVSASYPAPPAIANAYINSTNLKSSAPKVRGCVLNQIAAKHANGQQYGAAPGPYDEAFVRADVMAFWPSCGGGTPAP